MKCNCENQHAKKLTFACFNVWAVDLPIPRMIFEDSKDTDDRMQMIPYKLAESGADIILLQEVWQPRRKKALAEKLKHLGYPYHTFQIPEKSWWSLKWGNGLMIVSKYPIDPKVDLLTFKNSTRSIEGFALKGAIMARVSVPCVGWVEVVNTHLGAFSTLKSKGKISHFNHEHLRLKYEQTLELRNFLKEKSTSEFMVLAGDFNTHFYSLKEGNYVEEFATEYEILTRPEAPANHGTGAPVFLDTYRAANGFECKKAFTYDTNENQYAKKGLFQTEPPGVLDYIFLKKSDRAKVLESRVIMHERPSILDKLRYKMNSIPSQLSDHFGVLATIEFG